MTDQENQILRNLVLLLVALVPFFSLGLSNHGLWSADEPRVAEIGREMALTGNWAVPTLNQKPFLEHPPLYYVLLGYTFKALGGASDKVARIPSALFAFAGVVVVFFIAISSLVHGLLFSLASSWQRQGNIFECPTGSLLTAPLLSSLSVPWDSSSKDIFRKITKENFFTIFFFIFHAPLHSIRKDLLEL